MPRYSENENRILSNASSYAREFGKANPYTIHFLHALLQEDDVRLYLKKINKDVDWETKRLKNLGHESAPYSYASERPTVSKPVRNIMKRGKALALTLNMPDVRAMHFLWGVTQERSTPAARFLADIPIDSGDLLEYIAGYENVDAPQSAETPELRTVPAQTEAPIVLEYRHEIIASVDTGQGLLLAIESDVDRWREPVTNHLDELLQEDFRHGTNHSRVRERLLALKREMSGSTRQLLSKQFKIGYDIERLGRLIDIYRTGDLDLPSLNEVVLQDLIHFHLQMMIGIGKFEDWNKFKAASGDKQAENSLADSNIVSDVIESIASVMEDGERKAYFDPELPKQFRALVEAVNDPWGATKTVVYGAVRSVKNLLSFLAQTALLVMRSGRDATAKTAGIAAAGALLMYFSHASLALSNALPSEWLWLKHILEALAKASTK